MEQRFLGNSGLSVSALSFGTMTIGGRDRFAKMGSLGVDETGRILDLLRDTGVTHLRPCIDLRFVVPMILRLPDCPALSVADQAGGPATLHLRERLNGTAQRSSDWRGTCLRSLLWTP